MSKNIIIVGSQGHAKVVIDIVESEGIYSISGLIDPFRKIGEEVLGYKILGSEQDIPRLSEDLHVEGVHVAIGDNAIREKVADKVSSIFPKVRFVSAIHRNSHIGKATTIGEGSVIMPGATVNSSSTIGKFCIVNTGSSLDHDSIMEDFSSLAPGVHTGGYCKIGHHSAICVGAILFDRITIGEHSVVGGGSLVNRNMPSYCVSYGLPAKKIRDRVIGEKYL